MHVPLSALARRRSVWIATLAAALAIRLAFVATAPHDIPWSDGRAYEEAGWRLIAEHRYTAPYNIPPGYPFFIAAVYAVTGRHLIALRVVEAVVSTATVALAGTFAAAIFSAPVGLLAALLTAFHPVLAFLPITHYAENLFAFLCVLVFGAFAAAVRRPALGRWGAAGALFGLFALIKPVALTCLPGLALGASVELARARAPRLRHALVFALAMVAVIAPWTLRNHAVFGRWILVSGGGERQLWAANNPDATGWDAPRTHPAWLADSLRSREVPFGWDRFYGEQAWAFMRRHPARALQLYGIRFLNLWSPYPRTITRTRYSTPLADASQGLYSLVLYAGLLLGFRRLGRARIPYLWMAALGYFLAGALFITVLRYRLGMEIVLIWIAALGYAAWLGRRSEGAHDPPAVQPGP